MINLENIPVDKWLEMNAKLQQKKSAARKDLSDMGIVGKDKKNQFDGYSYLSESGYKKIFTDLFSKHGLELKSDEIEYQSIQGVGKTPIGRMAKIRFTLFDTETGFFESTEVTGEGLDRGDKAGYKAFTGALKYYLATTFMVATGDDAEKDSPQGQPIQQQQKPAPNPRKINKKQIDIIKIKFHGKEDALKKILENNNVSRVEDLTQPQAVALLDAINKKEMKTNEVAGNQQSNS